MILYSYGLAFLELTFILVSFLLLHRLKQAIGNGPFYLALGAVMVFTQFVTAIGLNLTGIHQGLEISVGSSIFFTPFMAALLIVYIVDGTLETQRMMLGMLAILGVFIYIAFLTEKQIEFPLYTLSPDISAGFAQRIFGNSRTYMLASLLSILIQFFALPVVYEILRNRNCRMGLSVCAALVFVQVLDAFFFELVIRFPAEDWWDGLRSSYISRAIAMLWVSALTTIYLKLRDAPRSHEASSRRPLDIVVAFLGAYGQAQRLSANVRDWEGRYRMVVENSNDLIFLVSRNGMILDANRTAVDASGYVMDHLLKLRIPTFTRTESGQAFDWQSIWKQIYPDPNETSSEGRLHVGVQELHMTTRTGHDLVLDAVISPIMLQDTEAALVVCRDVTQRKKFENERQVLEDQLLHSQRMEAVGKLAGGIAHDFNNLLHAIQGSLDVLEKSTQQDDKAKQMVSNIGTAVTRASNLTDQLLGFARGGKYQVEQIEVLNLVKQTEELFRPLLGKNVKLRVVIHPDPMIVEGDFTQLQQVLFNFLLNAVEALPDAEGRIIFRGEPATEFTPGWNKTWTDREPDDYIVVRVRDNGTGISDEVRRRIFEPFFTTKEQKGTGMGLAMAYGCVQNHNGWIYVDSTEGTGSEFFVFLPRLK